MSKFHEIIHVIYKVFYKKIYTNRKKYDILNIYRKKYVLLSEYTNTVFYSAAARQRSAALPIDFFYFFNRGRDFIWV